MEKKHLQQADAPPVRRKAVTDAAGGGIADAVRRALPVNAAGGAGGVIFGGGAQYFQFLH